MGDSFYVDIVVLCFGIQCYLLSTCPRRVDNDRRHGNHRRGRYHCPNDHQDDHHHPNDHPNHRNSYDRCQDNSMFQSNVRCRNCRSNHSRVPNRNLEHGLGNQVIRIRTEIIKSETGK